MVNLGDEVKDPVTGIKGIAYVKLSYLQGCDRIGVQQPAYKDKEGDMQVPNLWHVDEPQLIVVKEKVIKKGDEGITGGPSKFVTDNKRQ